MSHIINIDIGIGIGIGKGRPLELRAADQLAGGVRALERRGDGLVELVAPECEQTRALRVQLPHDVHERREHCARQRRRARVREAALHEAREHLRGHRRRLRLLVARFLRPLA